MRTVLKTSESVTAVLSGAATTTNPTYAVDVVDAHGVGSGSTGSLTDTTAVTLASGGAIPKIVNSIVISNIDTVAAVVTLKKVASDATTKNLLAPITLQVNDTLVVDSAGVRVLDSSGQIKTSQAASTALPLLDKRTPTATTDTATITIAQLLAKILQATPTAAATYTLPTAALLVAGISNCRVGDSFDFIVENRSGGANTVTVAAGSGGTGKGTLTCAQNIVRAYKITVTNVGSGTEAYMLYGIG